MSRVYNVDGIELPSVTTILETLSKGDGVMFWACKCTVDYIRDNHKSAFGLEETFSNATMHWTSVLSEAATVGSEAHAMIEEFILTGSCSRDSHTKQAVNAFDAFLKWQEHNKPEWLKSEMEVYSHTWGYAGTLDAICLLQGKRYVIDFKTSGNYRDSHRLQIAAYRNAAEESGEEVEGCAILRLDKETAEPEFKDFSARYPRDRETFLKLSELYYLLKDRRLKNNPHVLVKEKPTKIIHIAKGVVNG